MIRRVGWGLRILYNFIRLPLLCFFSLGRIRFSAFEMLDSTVKVRVGNAGFINFGEKCTIDDGTLIRSSGGVISIGDSVYINRNCNIVSRSSIKIGNGVSIGPNVCIYDHDHNFNSGKKCFYNVAPILIGENVWIGAGAIILKGVIIGEESVIAAGAIITEDVPPNTVVTMQKNILLRGINRNGEHINCVDGSIS